MIHSFEAGETIQNFSVGVVKNGKVYRLRSDEILRIFPTVFINNVSIPNEEVITTIEKGQLCRCFDCHMYIMRD